eukprot:CAMPEP_0170510218 /NCGR_PEP_ID=MMETSP0208-20121228/65650_1 /TAXON_ID=197538 /ORGANISM="Strombidium inclinatum, Strain S3" /LENGTH=273 /DNA_ID=CAMNT_0010793667 /DNA_START=959 /DNA_END=1780 /DNA_ORIENTATION=+
MKNHIFDHYPSNRDITLEEWKQESHRFMHIYPSDVEDRLLETISSDDGNISKAKLIDLLDIFHFVPFKVKQEKNKSENIYFVLNSNKRGGFRSKEQLLENLKKENEKMHISKIMTLIAIKIEEKFHSMAKAFLFFDHDSDQRITRAEFNKGIEGLRVKLSKHDIEHVFTHMDEDEDGCLSYKEFCGFAEEKRRNIDPFEDITKELKETPSILSSPKQYQSSINNSSLTHLQKTPYSNLKPNSIFESGGDSHLRNGPRSLAAGGSNISFDDLES